jgi:hypothetical protein
MFEIDGYGLNNSNVNRYWYPATAERHLEGYEQGEAINAFLELKATDNDYLAFVVRVLEELVMQYEASFFRLALGIADFGQKDPPVDEEIVYKDNTAVQVLSRMAKRLKRFLSEEALEAAD